MSTGLVSSVVGGSGVWHWFTRLEILKFARLSLRSFALALRVSGFSIFSVGVSEIVSKTVSPSKLNVLVRCQPKAKIIRNHQKLLEMCGDDQKRVEKVRNGHVTSVAYGAITWSSTNGVKMWKYTNSKLWSSSAGKILEQNWFIIIERRDVLMN